MSGIGYRLEIDGLRAVAVIPVILFHMGLSWIPGGFIGVDVFFVISGFLITSIIRKELEDGTFSFRDFWARRVRRILPAMISVTACTLAATYFFVFRPDQQPIGKQALAALMSVANIYYWLTTGDYWGTAAEDSPFLHAWSLSVEEQFYLFFPIAMWLIFRFQRRRLQGAIATATVGSLALFLWRCNAHPASTFYLLPTRMWELGAGCLLAVSPTLSSPPSQNSHVGVFATVGLGMVVLSYIFFDMLSGGLGLAVVGTALIISCGQSGLCNRFLSQRPLVHIGKLSYSLYLWHWPILVLARLTGVDSDGALDKVVLIAATYLLALGTYHLVEKPTRRRNGLVPKILASGTLVAGIAFAMAVIPNKYDASQFNQAKFFDYSPDPKWELALGPRWLNITRANPGYYPDALKNGGIRIEDESEEPKLVVVGDSHAQMWSDAIATVSKSNNIPTAFFSQCGERWWDADFDKEESFVYQFVEEWKPQVVVVALSWRQKRGAGIEQFLQFAGAQGSRVLLIEDPPWLLPCGQRSSIQWLASRGIKPVEGKRQYLLFEDETPAEGGRQWVRALADKYEFADLVPVFDLYTTSDGIMVLDGKDAIHIDIDHLSSHGAHIAVRRLQAAILNGIKK